MADNTFSPKLLSARPRVSQALQQMKAVPFTDAQMAVMKVLSRQAKPKKKKGVSDSLQALTGDF